MSKKRSFTELLEMIESNRKEWLKNAPLASDVTVVKRSESLTVRLAKEETDALEMVAVRLGITKSTLLRIIIREYLGLNRGYQGATKPLTRRVQLVSKGESRFEGRTRVAGRSLPKKAKDEMHNTKSAHATRSK